MLLKRRKKDLSDRNAGPKIISHKLVELPNGTSLEVLRFRPDNLIRPAKINSPK
jgi:hypothetical protein